MIDEKKHLGLTLLLVTLVALALIAFIVWVMPREEKPGFPQYERVEDNIIPSSTPEPEEFRHGKG
jgi:hypothetical protein